MLPLSTQAGREKQPGNGISELCVRLPQQTLSLSQALGLGTAIGKAECQCFQDLIGHHLLSDLKEKVHKLGFEP